MTKFRIATLGQQFAAFAAAFVFSSACVLSAVGPAEAQATSTAVHAVA